MRFEPGFIDTEYMGPSDPRPLWVAQDTQAPCLHQTDQTLRCLVRALVAIESGGGGVERVALDYAVSECTRDEILTISRTLNTMLGIT